jgi:hypothetical protein
MCALRRVEGERAGPNALGILVPPARRTFLILRPRGLSWDLLLVRDPEGSTFRELGRDEGHAAAQDLYRSLEGQPDETCVEARPAAEGGSWVRARVGTFALLACARVPGQPYRPQVFADENEGYAAARAIAEVLCPPAGVEQEVYFNTRHFGR